MGVKFKLFISSKVETNLLFQYCIMGIVQLSMQTKLFKFKIGLQTKYNYILKSL